MYSHEHVSIEKIEHEIGPTNDHIRSLIAVYNNVLDVYIDFPLLSYATYDNVANRLYEAIRHFIGDR
jgi:hypothetical protein